MDGGRGTGIRPEQPFSSPATNSLLNGVLCLDKATQVQSLCTITLSVYSIFETK